MDPHGSQIENAFLKEEKVRDKTHNVVLGMNELVEQLEAKNTTKRSFFKGAACTPSVATGEPQTKISSGVLTNTIILANS